MYLDLLPEDPFSFKTWNNLKPSSLWDDEFCRRKRAFLDRLQPVQDIQSDIDVVTAAFHSSMVGVHVRTTDTASYWKYGEYPGMDLYCAEMDACLDRNPDTHFFVCADDDAIIEHMFTCYGHRVLSSNAILGRSGASRFSREGQAAAVVDLYCLARTSRIIGTRFSSFSYDAAALGAVPIVTISGTSVHDQ